MSVPRGARSPASGTNRHRFDRAASPALSPGVPATPTTFSPASDTSQLSWVSPSASSRRARAGRLSPWAEDAVESVTSYVKRRAGCCGSGAGSNRQRRRTAQRLLLPPRPLCKARASVGALAVAESRRACWTTWVVMVVGVLLVPLALACSYASFLAYEYGELLSDADASGEHGSARMPWLQLAAVVWIGGLLVYTLASAWLRWPRRSSGACICLGFAVACVLLVATLLLNVAYTAANNSSMNSASLQVLEPVNDTQAECSVLPSDPVLDEYCGAEPRVAVLWPGANLTSAGDAGHFLRDMHIALTSVSISSSATEEDHHIQYCMNSIFLPALCDSVVQICSEACVPRKPCGSRCSQLLEECPQLHSHLAAVDESGSLFEPLSVSTSPDRAHAMQRLVTGLLRCGDESFWSDAQSCDGDTATATVNDQCATGADEEMPNTDVRSLYNGTLRELYAPSVAIVGGAVLSSWIVFVGSAVAGLRAYQCAAAPLASKASLKSASTSLSVHDSTVRANAKARRGDSRSGAVASSSNQHGQRPSHASIAFTRDSSTDSAATSLQDPWALPGATAVIDVNTPSNERRSRVSSHLRRSRDLEHALSGSLSPTHSASSGSQLSPFAARVSASPGLSVLRLPRQAFGVSPAVLMRGVNARFSAGEGGRVSGSGDRLEHEALQSDGAGTTGTLATYESADETQQRLMNPDMFHVLDSRNFAAAAVSAASGCCLLRMGLTAEEDGAATAAAALNTVAVLAIVMAVSCIGNWQFSYARGISIFRDGERTYSRMRATDAATFISRARFRILWLRGRWRYYFGMGGRYVTVRVSAAEAIEVCVQVLGLLDRLETVANNEVIFIISLLTINGVGGVLIRERQSSGQASETLLLFELACDVAYLAYAAVAMASSPDSTPNAVQIAVLLVPALFALATLRRMNWLVIRAKSHTDAQAAGVVRHLGATRRNRRAVLRARSSTADASDGDEAAEKPCIGKKCLIRACSNLYAAVVVFVMVPAAVATVTRLIFTEAECARTVGPLWHGVGASSKYFLQNGLFSEPACFTDQVTALDLRNVNVEEIGEEVTQFSALREIDARGNPSLRVVTSAVARLSHLRTLRLDDTAAEDQVDWSYVGLVSLPRVLQSMSGVRSLDVSGNSIRSLDHGVIRAMTALQSLDVSHNLLEELPDALSALPSLTVLDASKNVISELPVSLWPALERLTSLDIGSNALTTLPGVLGRHRLDSLRVDGNDVTELAWSAVGATFIPEAVQSLPIERVDLSWNGLHELPLGLANMHTVKHLDVSNNALTSLDRWIGDLPSITAILAYSNFFADAGGVASVFDAPTLEEIDLSCNQLQQLPKEAWTTLQLRTLELGFNPLMDLSLNEIGNATAPLASVNLEDTLIEAVPDALTSGPLASTLRAALLPGLLQSTDPAGVERLGEQLGSSCRLVEAGTDSLLLCGEARGEWPRDSLRAVCEHGP